MNSAAPFPKHSPALRIALLYPKSIPRLLYKLDEEVSAENSGLWLQVQRHRQTFFAGQIFSPCSVIGWFRLSGSLHKPSLGLTCHSTSPSSRARYGSLSRIPLELYNDPLLCLGRA